VSIGAIGAASHASWPADATLKAAPVSVAAPAAQPEASPSNIAAAPPFLNPAIGHIAARAAQAPEFAVSAARPDVVPTDAVLYGDSGFLIQAYAAVALLTGPVALTPAYGLPSAPAIPAVSPIMSYPPIAYKPSTEPKGVATKFQSGRSSS
jgi:hypothetical protein